MSQQKQMFKVLCPVKRSDGGTFWMRLGVGFRNKDNSINLHLDAVPTGGECKLQIREFDDEDRRRSEARRSDEPGFTSRVPALQSVPSAASDTVPF